MEGVSAAASLDALTETGWELDGSELADGAVDRPNQDLLADPVEGGPREVGIDQAHEEHLSYRVVTRQW